MRNLFGPGPRGHLAALLVGCFMPLAFAPANLFFIAFLGPALLLGLWLYVGKYQAFLRGFLFGLGMFGTGVYWIFISIHTFGQTPALLALLITLLFISTLSLFPGLAGLWLNKVFPENTASKFVFAFPVFWLFTEWLRSWVFSGFPWLTLGYSQMNVSPLRHLAPVGSLYLVSFAVLLTSGLIFVSCFIRKQQRWVTLSCIGLLWMSAYFTQLISWTTPTGTSTSVSLVQGNVAQSLKWSPEHTQASLDRYWQLSQAHLSSTLIVWPEAAIPLLDTDASDMIVKLNKLGSAHHTSIISGIPIAGLYQGSLFNGAMLMGAGHGEYLKRHLVPFGEYWPLGKSSRKLAKILDIPMSNFVAGPSTQRLFHIGELAISTSICYEIAFPEEVRAYSRKANVLLVISDDAWFGHSVAQAQHLQMAQMRALELGRPLLFASNNGITAIIKPDGSIEAQLAPYTTNVLEGSFQPTQGKTLWQLEGTDPLILFFSFWFLIGCLWRKRQKPLTE